VVSAPVQRLVLAAALAVVPALVRVRVQALCQSKQQATTKPSPTKQPAARFG
jgi:hypothetical protein